MEFIISISSPGKSWNSSEGHGKAICFWKIKRQKDSKFEKITDKLERGFEFSRNKDKHIFYALQCWEICS